jgi:hypothetical protein
LLFILYFDDAESEPMPQMLVPFDWEGVQTLLYPSGARHRSTVRAQPDAEQERVYALLGID